MTIVWMEKKNPALRGLDPAGKLATWGSHVVGADMSKLLCLSQRSHEPSKAVRRMGSAGVWRTG